MTPKTLEQMAEEYYRSDERKCSPDLDFLAGAKAALSLSEVLAMREALDNLFHAPDAQCFSDERVRIPEALAAFARLSGEVGWQGPSQAEIAHAMRPGQGVE